jgi:hypothetical protein
MPGKQHVVFRMTSTGIKPFAMSYRNTEPRYRIAIIYGYFFVVNKRYYCGVGRTFSASPIGTMPKKKHSVTTNCGSYET